MKKLFCYLPARLITLLLFQVITFSAFCVPVVQSYELDYKINFSEQKLFCKAGIIMKNIKVGGTLSFLLYRLLKVKSVYEKDGSTLRFTQKISAFEEFDLWQVNQILIYTDRLKAKKNTAEIIIEFEGYLAGYTETGMGYVKDNINTEYTILRPDCFAYPVPGVLSWEKTRTMHIHNFDYSINVTVPDSLIVVNGGQLRGKKIFNGTVQYSYKNSKPAWRIDIVIAKYSTLSEDSLFVYYFPEDAEGARKVLEAVKKTHTILTAWFGTNPSPGYSIIEIPDGWGSQTDVTCILQSASAFKSEANLIELYHEISHLWNVKSTDVSPCRLESEGLATFLQYLLEEKITGRAATLDNAAKKIYESLKRKLVNNTLACNTAIRDYGEKHLTDYSYTKGMLFFYSLYKTVGENLFLTVIKGFYDRYRTTGATIADFCNYMIGYTKNKKVEQIVNDWIFTANASKKFNTLGNFDDLLK